MHKINNMSIFPMLSEYIRLSKLPLSERFNNKINSLLLSLSKDFLVCCPETKGGNDCNNWITNPFTIQVF